MDHTAFEHQFTATVAAARDLLIKQAAPLQSVAQLGRAGASPLIKKLVDTGVQKATGAQMQIASSLIRPAEKTFGKVLSGLGIKPATTMEGVKAFEGTLRAKGPLVAKLQGVGAREKFRMADRLRRIANSPAGKGVANVFPDGLDPRKMSEFGLMSSMYKPH